MSVKIKFVSAELIRDTEVVGKMDPYVKILYGDKYLRTSTQESAGKNPVWNQELEFLWREQDAWATIQVIDDDVGADQIIGTVELNCYSLKPGQQQTALELTHDGKPAGQLRTVITYSGVMAYQLNCVSAKLLRDTETFGKMDPFVQLLTKNDRVRTNTKEEAGKTPVWNEVIYTIPGPDDDKIAVSVEDFDGEGKEDVVGTSTISIANLKEGQAAEELKLTYKDKDAGSLKCESVWAPAVTLQFHLVRGIFTFDTETFGKMDPYCRVKFCQKSFSTQAMKDAGQVAKWDRKFLLNVSHVTPHSIQFICSDKDGMGADDVIGEGTIKVSDIKDGENVFKVKLLNKKNNQEAGDLEVNIIRNGGPKPPQQANNFAPAKPKVNDLSQLKAPTQVVPQEQVSQQVQSVFQAYDYDKSGHLNRNEFHQSVNELMRVLGYSQLSQQVTESIFAKYDVDKSNSLQVGEFAKIVKEVFKLG